MVRIPIKENLPDSFAILALTLSFPLFFYKLGQSSLVSWDEAWYASIARNILISQDLINLTWNGAPYFDHPPAGFWLMALTFKIFGINEFWVRFPSALFAVATLIMVYLAGKELFSKFVGCASALALLSAPWFLFRARSGNLDIFLTFFFVLTFFTALKVALSRRYRIIFTISLALLLLTKTMIPLVIFPVLVLMLNDKSLRKKIIRPLLFALFLSSVWFIVQIINHPEFINRYIFIGFPEGGIKGDYLKNADLALSYLHQGIGKWYWPGLLSLVLGMLLIKRKFLLLPLFCLTFLLPTIFSPKVQIWHLIPLYPFLILNSFGVAFVYIHRMTSSALVASIIILAVAVYLSVPQIKQSWYQFIDIPAYISDEAILAGTAASSPLPLYIDGDFDPTANFYSSKNVTKIYKNDLLPLFQNKRPFLLITNQWRLDESAIPPTEYSIIKTDRDKELIIVE